MKPFAITMGDACGVGPEIIVKMAADSSCPAYPFFILGDVGVLSRAVACFKLPIRIVEIFDIKDCYKDTEILTLPVMQCGLPLPKDLAWGNVDSRAGKTSFLSFAQAIHFAMNEEIAGIVTAPMNKTSIKIAGYDSIGHTEILTEFTGLDQLAMMFVHNSLNIMLVSIHVSLLEAIKAVTVEKELEIIRLAHKACLDLGILCPKIAVAGLNPHAGENGLFGKEEEQFIKPAIEIARKEGIDATGPWPGDTIFMQARGGNFDLVVAQYHDQGILPIKCQGICSAVQITVGLPFIRTSVDHGTAFDIAWSGRANYTGILLALQKAIEIFLKNNHRLLL